MQVMFRKPVQHGFGFRPALGALDEAAAQNPGVVAVVAIEHAGLARGEAGLAIDKLYPDGARPLMQYSRTRGPGRAYLGEEFHSLGGDAVKRYVAKPVDRAQVDLVRLQRFARADDHSRPVGVEM